MKKLQCNDPGLLYKVMDVPTKSSAFDYLKNPLECNNLRALMRLWDLIPIISETILAEIQDRLDDGGLFVHTIKYDYSRINRLLSENSRRAMDRYKEDETENCATVDGEYHLQLKLIDEFCRKILPYMPRDTRDLYKTNPDFREVMSLGRVKAFVRKFVSLLGMLEGMMNVDSLIEYKINVIDKCKPMGQLEVGQQFIFPYAEHAMDDGGQSFTYLGLASYPTDKGENIVAQYRKLNDSIHVVYEEQNALRAVIPLP